MSILLLILGGVIGCIVGYLVGYGKGVDRGKQIMIYKKRRYDKRR